MSSWDESDPAAIAFMFVVCARTADGELVEAEVVRIVERIAAWMPGASLEQIRGMIGRAVDLYRSAPDSRSLHELVGATGRRLRALLAAEERERLITELIGLSDSDGQVDAGETNFVLAVAKLLEVEVALTDD